MLGAPERPRKSPTRYIKTIGICVVAVGGMLLPAPANATAAPKAVHPTTVPGQPGTPQAPTTLFSEDFENRGATPIRLTGYTGTTGETYTANQAWLQNCNGWVASFNDPAGSNAAVAAQVADCQPKTGGPGTPGATAWNNVRTLAQALGVLNGNGNANRAVSAYTNGPINNGDPGAGLVEFQTVQPITVNAAGRYITMEANVAETSCAANKNHALLDFNLLNGTAAIPVTSVPIDPCTAGGHTIQGSGTTAVIGGTYTGDTPLLFTGPSLGLQMVNEQGSGNGNDHAFDDIKLLDVTPQLDKTFSPDTVQVGGTSTLTFTVTNTSDLLAKTGWSFTDTLPTGLTLAAPSAAANTCGGTITSPDGGTAVGIAGGTLAAGQTSCTVSVNVTSAAAGTYTNDATNVTAISGLNPPGSSSITFTSTPTIDLVKSVSPPWFSAAGQTLNYRFLVTNPSTVQLSGVAVTDTDLPGLSAITCPVTTLAAGASTTCTATYTTTTADLTAGRVNNSATANGTPPTGPPIISVPSTASVPALIPPVIIMSKTATPSAYSMAGQLITFSYLVTNPSAVTLSGIAVNDTLPGITTVKCPQPTLAPGVSEKCTATYQVTAADLDAGSITNTATAQGTPPDTTTPVISPPGTVTIPAVQQPAITIAKSAAPSTFAVVGQPISYSYLVTNTGNVTLTGVTVHDPLPGLSAITCPSDALPAGISETCTAAYAITIADLDAGSVRNTATATGTPPTGAPVVSDPDTTTITAATAPAISLVKSASVGAFSRVGQVIIYSYLVTNTGNIELTNVGVTDTLPGLPAVVCPRPALDIGESETCTASYTATATNFDAGRIVNFATAQGIPLGSTTPVVSTPSTITLPLAQAPSITVVKSAIPTAFATAGETISYSYLVSNTGNVTLSGVAISDTLPGVSAVNCPLPVLGAGDSETCTASYTTTSADVTAHSILNTADAQGFSPGTTDVPVISSPSTLILTAADAPAIAILKVASPNTYDGVGRTIDYLYPVGNSGNVPLINITVTDHLPGLSAITCPLATLGVGAREVCSASYITTQADLNAGQVVDTATAQGTPPTGPPAVSVPSTAVATAITSPAIRVVKSVTPASYSKVGQVLNYTFLVTNTGDVTLTAVRVADTLKGLSAITCPLATLTAGQSETCAASYRVAGADLDAGHVKNTATAYGDPPNGALPVSSPPSSTTDLAVQQSTISVVKSAVPDIFDAVGQVIHYSFRVTNTGNVTLIQVRIADTLPGLSAVACPRTTLTAGQLEICSATYRITKADLDTGQLQNAAIAHGRSLKSEPVVSSRSTVTIKAAPFLQVTG